MTIKNVKMIINFKFCIVILHFDIPASRRLVLAVD